MSVFTLVSQYVEHEHLAVNAAATSSPPLSEPAGDYSSILVGMKDSESASSFMMLSQDELLRRLSVLRNGKRDGPFASTYEFGRSIFLAVKASTEKAMKHFVLEGYVSDHIELCLYRANAYKTLSVFEPDEKRKQAMNLKRVQSIEVLLKDGGINESAYAGLMKTLAHEVGAAYLDMHDIKMARIAAKRDANPGYSMKNAEAVKLNQLAHSAVFYFSYFLKLYIPSEEGKAIDLESMSVQDADKLLVKVYFVDPEETVGYMGAHFKIAWLLSRIKPELQGGSAGRGKAEEALKRSLTRFNFLLNYVDALKEKMKNKSDSENDYAESIQNFKEQIEICRTMKVLLLEKIAKKLYD